MVMWHRPGSRIERRFGFMKADLLKGRVKMEVQYWYIILFVTTFVIPGIILLGDDGTYTRKGK